MKYQLIIAVENGRASIEGPINSPALCAKLLAAGQECLAEILRRQEQQAREETPAPPPAPRLFLLDGSLAPSSTDN